MNKNEREHITDGRECWCNPKVIKVPGKIKNPKECGSCGGFYFAKAQKLEFLTWQCEECGSAEKPYTTK